MDFEKQTVLVYGTGISGIAATNLLLAKGADVILFDENSDLDCEKVKQQLNDTRAVTIVTGSLSEELLEMIDVSVLSPGVPLDVPMVELLKNKGIPIWGEIELAYRCQKGDVLAVTGTNGKTTMVSLLGEIMKNACSDARIVGNIGIPYTSEVSHMTEQTVTVAEISSFQLETIDQFHPRVSAILNITPDHLNRHHTMKKYVDAKLNIAKNQTKDDICVLNYEDKFLRERANGINATIIWFSGKQRLEEGVYLDGDSIWYKTGDSVEKIIDTTELNILGRHNYENVMAATAVAHVYGVDFETIRSILRQFQAVEHRIEYVTEKDGIYFYNDSKGTNPDAAMKGIEAMERPTYLIAGGYDKQSDYREWIQSFDGKVKKLVLIGQTAEKIAETAKSMGFVDYLFADSLQEAVHTCYELAEHGEAILLSPACASWGMFPNYEVRGKMFKDIVHAIKE